jgi:hypothetical protein
VVQSRNAALRWARIIDGKTFELKKGDLVAWPVVLLKRPIG